MKVFISSIIGGFTMERDAARRAVTTLRYEPVMAEDFGAQPNSPQVACLQALRGSDLMVLILAEQYGFVPPGSSISATHQEYREARGTKDVLAFVKQGMNPEPEQAAFIEEVQAWEGGLFRSGYETPNDLYPGIIRALHDVTLNNAVGPVDEGDLIARAEAQLPAEVRNQVTPVYLNIALACGPRQQILRPSEIEAEALAEGLQQEAMFGAHRLFDRTLGARAELVNGSLVLQQDGGASICLTETGSITLRLPLDRPSRRGHSSFDGMVGSVIIEEDVRHNLTVALSYTGALIERLDATQRFTHVAISTRIAGAEFRAWRTHAQHAASPNSVQMGMGGSRDRTPVSVVVRRAALRLDRTNLIDDILVPLRRQFPTG
jgi:hypothetical protein